MAYDLRYLDYSDNEGRIFWVLIITVALMLVEVAIRFIQGFLALRADAGHMLTAANDKTLLKSKRLLVDDLGIIHSTIQIECCACADDH